MKDETPGMAGDSEGGTSQDTGTQAGRANNEPAQTSTNPGFKFREWVTGNPAQQAQADFGGLHPKEWFRAGNTPAAPARPAGNYTPPTPAPAGADRYAAAALTAECAAVAATTEGSRNHQLNTSAYNLGQLIGCGALDRGTVESALRDAARACGLTDTEVGPTLASGINSGMQYPRTIPEATSVNLGDTDVGDLGGGNTVDSFEAAVAVQLATLRVREEARRRLTAEQRPPVALPPVTGLTALLDEPDDQIVYTIDQLHPAGGRTLLSAQQKAGKTTTVNNMVGSLADGVPFLGRFAPTTGPHRIAIVDNEMARNNTRRWLRAQGITNTDAVVDVVNLRGRVSAFDLTDDTLRARWAQRFADLGVTFLVFDCLRPILDALGLNEHNEAGRFLVSFDALLADAGITDALLVHHMGHNGDRARGDSRILDWPDAIWRLMREDPENPASPRYMAAHGRDVDLPEGLLTFDPHTKRLTYGGTSRAEQRTEGALRAVLGLLAAAPGPVAAQAIETGLTGLHPRKAVRDATGAAIQRGLVAVTSGARGARLHSIASPCAECRMPVASGRQRHEQCPASVDGLEL